MIPLAEDISASSILGMVDRQESLIRPVLWSPKMIYRIVTYDRTTDRMKGNLPIPSSVLKQIKRIAGFGPNDDGLGEYPLDEAQTRQVARILDFNPEPDRFYYYVEPYEPTKDDDGLQPITKSAK
jgi:hypothetical protein